MKKANMLGIVAGVMGSSAAYATASASNVMENQQSSAYSQALAAELVDRGVLVLDDQGRLTVTDEAMKELKKSGILKEFETKMASDTNGWPNKTK